MMVGGNFMENEIIRKPERDVSMEDFCEPYEGEQKEECIYYYEKWFDEEEKQEQSGEKTNARWNA